MLGVELVSLGRADLADRPVWFLIFICASDHTDAHQNDDDGQPQTTIRAHGMILPWNGKQSSDTVSRRYIGHRSLPTLPNPPTAGLRAGRSRSIWPPRLRGGFGNVRSSDRLASEAAKWGKAMPAPVARMPDRPRSCAAPP